MPATSSTVLIIEPNARLVTPYSELPSAYSILRVSATEQALDILATITPSLVFLSTSYSMTKILEILEQLKSLSTKKIIPVVFVVDWSHKLSTLPGTTWGNQIGLLHSLSSKQELLATLKRIT
jgi:PleD family two-component response regulator